jgi:eukaryotic-like serine/threonine-protein kinase
MVELFEGKLIDGKYRLIRCVGEGGMGQAWLAEQITLRGLQVVLKFIKAGSRERFEREAETLASLRHPNIVFVQDYQAASPGPYIVMEYVGEGRSLEDTRLLDSLEVVDIASQIAEALFFMHLKGIIHRDLKPSNVLLERMPAVSENSLRFTRYHAKLADFGLARSLQDPGLTQPGDFLGTIYWAAPEQIRSAAQVDKRVDLYALGLLLYQMLTGREFPENYARAVAILRRARQEGDQLLYDQGRRLLYLTFRLIGSIRTSRKVP